MPDVEIVNKAMDRQELLKKLIKACTTCHHLKQKHGLICEVSISRCPKKRVRKWRKELGI